MPNVIFDPQCDLCVRMRDRMGRLDRARHLSWQSCWEAPEELKREHPDLTHCLHVIADDGSVLTGREAVSCLLTDLGLGGMVSMLRKAGTQVAALVEAGLDGVAGHQHSPHAEVSVVWPAHWATRVDELKRKIQDW